MNNVQETFSSDDFPDDATIVLEPSPIEVHDPSGWATPRSMLQESDRTFPRFNITALSLHLCFFDVSRKG
jgi:hypothetical protein